MDTIILDHDAVLKKLPDRLVTAHKGDFGRILLLCGSRGYTGAAALAAMGALRIGSGLVYLGVPKSIYTIEAGKLLEPIVFPLPDLNGKLCRTAIFRLSKIIHQMDAILIGPGLGRSDGIRNIVKWVLQHFNGSVVIDADGIFHLRDNIDILRGRKYPSILTPHEGEFNHLLGSKCTDRSSAAVSAANELNSIIVLKGHNTVITDGIKLFVNQTGNPGMAVGGSGDILAGMIAGLIGQGLSPLDAAACGAWIHGAAADICAEQTSMYGMLPSDMLGVIPRLLK